jgi:hypothetical protein
MREGENERKVGKEGGKKEGRKEGADRASEKTEHAARAEKRRCSSMVQCLPCMHKAH